MARSADLARGAVLLTDGFWPKTLVAARALREAGERVVCGEQTLLAPALWSRAVARRFQHADPIAQEERFVARLEEIAADEARRGPVVLMPMEEETLLVVLRHRDRLARHAAIPFADAALIERLRDKAVFGELARAHGLPTPRTALFRDRRELDAAIDSFGLPLVIKRRIGSGARGVDYADTREQAHAFGRAALDLDRSALAQERLPREGEAIGASLLMWSDGATDPAPAAPSPAPSAPRLVAGFVHRRLREHPVSGGSSTYREAIRDDALVRRCADFLAALGFTGVAMLEWKRDRRDDQLKLLECNPRFWGSLHQACLAGVPFPSLLARLARGERVEAVGEYRTDRRSRALFPGDLLHWWKAQPRPARFFWPDPAVVDELFRLDDPLPAGIKLMGFVPLLVRPGLRRLLSRRGAARAAAFPPEVSSARC
jgi:predicted ATP-grasp superfamily ATP-dependent carboligase